MDRLFSTLLVVGLVIAGLGAATVASMQEGDGPSFIVPADDEDLVEDGALARKRPRATASPTPSPEPEQARVARTRSGPAPAPIPVAEPSSGPRVPRSPGDDDANTDGGEGTAVGVGPDINDGQGGLPANPVDD